MYFLNQENKTLKKLKEICFTNVAGSSLFLLNFHFSHLIKKIKMLFEVGSVWSPKSMLDFCAFHLYVFTLCRDWNVENIYSFYGHVKKQLKFISVRVQNF